jgi:alkylmercury lyase-like protein
MGVTRLRPELPIPNTIWAQLSTSATARCQAADPQPDAECAVEACALSNQFPGHVVTVRSLCRETKAPVEVVGRDGVLLDYSPKTLRVHLGYPVREMARDPVGWCDYNSFFASEDAARQWMNRHPGIHRIRRAPEPVARLMNEVITKGRLEYGYQPAVPVTRVLSNLKGYGLTKPTIFGLPFLDPFWLPTPGTLRDARRRGWGFFLRVSL